MESPTSGLFGISEDHIEKYQSLDLRFIKNRAATFFFEASGIAMSPLILSKDVLIVDRSVDPSSGHIVVGSLNDQAFICRRFVKDANGLLLRAENPDSSDIKVEDDMDLKIFGVVRSIVREFI